MMILDHKKQIITLFSISIALALLVVISFWNAFDKDSKVPLTPFILALILIALQGYIFKLMLQRTNPKIIEDAIHSEVEKVRAEILAESLKKEEKEEESEQDIENLINQKIEKLLPSPQVKKLDTFAKNLLHGFATEFEFIQGIFFLKDESKKYRFLEGYALTNENPIPEFESGEGLTGQVAKSREIIALDEIPENYLVAESGLGKSKPNHLLIVPIVHDNIVIAILELASFKKISDQNFLAVQKSADKIASRLSKLI